METFNFETVRSDFHSLLNSLDVSLKDNSSNKFREVTGGREVILLYYRTAKTLYMTTIFICSDLDDDSDRNLYYSLSTPQLNRTLLEILFSIIYLLADFPTHNKMFFKALLREKKDSLEAFKHNYSGKPEWDNYLANQYSELPKFESEFKKHFSLNDDEEIKLDKDIAQNSERFPKPGNVIKRLKKSNNGVVPFLQFINDLLYRELSSKTHLEPSGLIDLSRFYLKPNLFFHSNSLKSKEEELIDFKTKQVWISIALVMCICSEIELNFDFGFKPKLTELWKKFIQGKNSFINEVYEKRYSIILNL